MQTPRFKLKQASAVLGVPPKDLQNLVQFGILRPMRRNHVYWFDTNLLLQAKVALYLKETLGSSSELLAGFNEAMGKRLGSARIGEDIRLRSRPLDAPDAVEIRIPFRALARELEGQIPRASTYQDLPKGRKRAGWKKDFVRNVRKAAADLGPISDEKILGTVRAYRSRRKKLPEITVVVRTKKKTA